MPVASKGSKISALIDECDCTPPTEDQRHAAALLVCANACDVTDAHDLMGMLGLLPGGEDDDFAVAPTPSWGHAV